MRNRIIIGLAILILGTGIIAAFSALNKNNDAKTSESPTNQIQQEAQQVSPTQMPDISPSPIASPVISPTAGQTFEIRGTIISVSGSTFVVDGRTITINPSRVVNFQQTTGVTVGNQVKVEGIIDNGTLFAREIKSLSEDNSGSGSSGRN